MLALFRQQHLEEARKTARVFKKKFSKESAWLRRLQLEEGRYFLGQKEFERALKIFQKVEEEGGEEADAAAYYAATARWEQNLAAPSEETAMLALKAQADFIRTYPGSPHAAAINLRLGNYYYDTVRNYLMAAGAYRQVLEASTAPEMKQEAIWKLLNCYKNAYEYDEAQRMAERLLREYPDHPRTRETQLEIGLILKDKGQYTEAIAHLEKVLEWAAGNQASEARFHIGESYQQMGDYRNAIQAYFKVRYHGSEGVATWITSADYKRAECYEALKEYDTAIGVYQDIIQREGGTSDFGALARKRIDELRQRRRVN